MMIRRGFLVLISALTLVNTAAAFTPQDLDQLHDKVRLFTEDHYKQAYGNDTFHEKVEVVIGSLDSRLRLANCENAMSFKLIEPAHNAHNVTVKTQCSHERPWTVYIPATINVYENVVVANRSLNRGEVLQEEDLTYKRMNTATIGRGLIADIDSADGLELKRAIRAGETLRSNYLRKPDVVKKGQPVVVRAQSRFLTVETTGVALVNGHVGERIKIKNDKSNRVVDAEVVAPGRVSVAIR